MDRTRHPGVLDLHAHVQQLVRARVPERGAVVWPCSPPPFSSKDSTKSRQRSPRCTAAAAVTARGASRPRPRARAPTRERSRRDHDSSWIESIWPSFRAAPRSDTERPPEAPRCPPSKTPRSRREVEEEPSRARRTDHRPTTDHRDPPRLRLGSVSGSVACRAARLADSATVPAARPRPRRPNPTTRARGSPGPPRGAARRAPSRGARPARPARGERTRTTARRRTTRVPTARRARRGGGGGRRRRREGARRRRGRRSSREARRRWRRTTRGRRRERGTAGAPRGARERSRATPPPGPRRRASSWAQGGGGGRRGLARNAGGAARAASARDELGERLRLRARERPRRDAPLTSTPRRPRATRARRRRARTSPAKHDRVSARRGGCARRAASIGEDERTSSEREALRHRREVTMFCDEQALERRPRRISPRLYFRRLRALAHARSSSPLPSYFLSL